MNTHNTQSSRDVSFEVTGETPEELTIAIRGHLDSQSAGVIWHNVFACVKEKAPPSLVVDGSAIAYCDVSGIGLLMALIAHQRTAEAQCTIVNLPKRSAQLLALFQKEQPANRLESSMPRMRFYEKLGRAVVALQKDMIRLIVFTGELSATFLRALRHPRLFRWKDIIYFIESGGIDAIPIVSLLSFLVGLIMAFQAAISMRQFGADIFVADLVALSLLRELAPLMTAVILAGRSGSAFAAELGTMKVNEEIDALHTMGLHPVRFLVINRVLAVLIFIPVLTLIANFAGLVGGAIVFKSLGFPLVTYMNQIRAAVSLNDFLGGFMKCFAFGVLIAAIGCLRGLEAKSGAQAVGHAATSAVVSGLTLIVIVDGVFSVVYYFLGI